MDSGCCTASSRWLAVQQNSSNEPPTPTVIGFSSITIQSVVVYSPHSLTRPDNDPGETISLLSFGIRAPVTFSAL